MLRDFTLLKPVVHREFVSGPHTEKSTHQNPMAAVVANNGFGQPPVALLEYWKPPKAIVFPHKATAPKRKVRQRSRNDLQFPIKQKEESSATVYPCDTDSRSDSLSSSDTTNSTAFVGSEKQRRFTWSDSTTTLIGTNNINTSALKSVPWGYYEKAKIRFSKLEIVTSQKEKMSGLPPAYRQDDEDNLKPHWWQIQHWSRKKQALLGVSIAAIIAIIVAVVVKVEKDNKYPNYNALNYSKVNECW